MKTLEYLRRRFGWMLDGYCTHLSSNRTLLSDTPSRRVITSTWWEGIVHPMMPRATPAGA
jgi:hypothetical protein